MAEVLVLAEHANGEVKKVTLELLTAARRLGSPAVVWTGPGADTAAPRLAEYGAEKVYVADGPEFDEYVVAPKAELLARLVTDTDPSAVLTASTAEGREIAGRLAVKTGSGVLTNAVNVTAGPDGRPLAEQANFGGSITVHLTVKAATPIIAIRPNAVALERSRRPVHGRPPAHRRSHQEEVTPGTRRRGRRRARRRDQRRQRRPNTPCTRTPVAGKQAALVSEREGYLSSQARR